MRRLVPARSAAAWRLALSATLALLAAACSLPGSEETSVPTTSGGDFGSGGVEAAPEGCATVDVAASPEKVELMTQLAEAFNADDAAQRGAGGGGCAFVRVARKASGAGATALADGWRDEAAEGPQPAVWSPAASSWGAVVNQRLADRGQAPVVPADATSFMLTPLVIAMPRPMAEALGWPDAPIGYADLLALSQDPAGWAARGHPEWGPFKLGKTNPNFSTSALSATVAQYYAATAKTAGLSLEDLNRPEVEDFNRKIESSVVHYGDTTLTFLNNLYRSDQRGVSLTYVSAVAVEEKSVLDYNRGNPDGITDPGEAPRPPRVPLVAIYPKEGTFFSDNPFFVLDAPWVDEAERTGARAFEAFVQRPENQARVLEFGFRPGNPQVAVAEPITAANGVDPDQPQATLDLPEPAVLVRAIEKWGEQRKGARVLLVLDVSGSMGEDAGDGRTKLDLAKAAATRSLDQFKADDQVGLRIFSTGLRTEEPSDYVDLLPVASLETQREEMEAKIRDLTPTQGTPLYATARASFDAVKASYDPARINAVVLLTDGRNEDPRFDDLDATLSTLRAGSEGQQAQPVRLFTVAYGADADLNVLRRLAEATNAAAYDAQDPATIDRVFTAVISNF